MPELSMKKIPSLLLITILLFTSLMLFSSCKENKQEDSNRLPFSEFADKISEHFSFNEEEIIDDFAKDLFESSFSVENVENVSSFSVGKVSVFYKDGLFHIREFIGDDEIQSYTAKIYKDGMVSVSKSDDVINTETVHFSSDEVKLFDDEAEMPELDLPIFDSAPKESDYILTDKENVYTFSKEYSQILKASLGDPETFGEEPEFILDMTEFDELGKLSLELKGIDEKVFSIKGEFTESKDEEVFKMDMYLEENRYELSLTLNESRGETKYEYTVKISNEEEKSEVKLHVILEEDKNEVLNYLNAKMDVEVSDLAVLRIDALFDRDELNEINEEGVSAGIEIFNGGKALAKIDLALSKKSDTEYELKLKSDNKDLMKDINATINTPAKSDIIIPDDVNKYLQNGDKIFSNYSEYSAKAKEISDEITEKIKDAEARKLALRSFRYDQKTDLYYFTDIKKDGHKLYASTYSVADHERKKYSYQEDLGDFVSFEKSRARLDAEYYISLLEKSIPEGFTVGSDGHDYLVFTKVRDIDAYLIFSPVDPSSYIVSCDLYNDVAATGKVAHELLIGDDGVGYVHKYNVTYNFDCEPKATCTACGFILNSTISNHRPCFEHIEEEDGKIKWRFVLCDRCDGGMIDFYSDTEAIVRVELDKMNYSISDAIVKNSEGLIEHYVPDFKNALVISEIEYIGKGDRYEKDSAFSVIIPDLRNCSDYRIIGVVEASRVNTHPAFIDLTLPEGVEFISRKSFYKSVVKTITLPNTLMYIDDMAFDQSRIEELTIPESVLYMGDNFGNCYLMKKLVVNSPELEVFPYINAPILETLEIKSRVEEFNMFGAVNFTEFTVPEGVSVILGNFDECLIEKVILPSTLREIGRYAFGNCPNLRSVKINSEITKIGDYAFAGCIALSDIKLPSSVKYIGTSAFSNCMSLTDDGIKQCTNLEQIRTGAFKGCTGLKNIVVPESVVILDKAFNGCKFDSIRFKCKFKDAGEFEADKVIYEGEILGKIRFGRITEIYAKILPTVKSVEIGGNAKIVYFAGSKEAFENAGYTWDETVTVNFDVDFYE